MSEETLCFECDDPEHDHHDPTVDPKTKARFAKIEARLRGLDGGSDTGSGLTRDDIRAEVMALLNDIFELKGENMKAEDFKQLDEAQKKEALAAELAALKTKIPPAVDLGPVLAEIEGLKAAIGVLAGDVQNTSARVGAIEEAILSAGGK
jgi:hypothetical protein